MPDVIKVADLGAEVVAKLLPVRLSEAEGTVARIAEELFPKASSATAELGLRQAAWPESVRGRASSQVGAPVTDEVAPAASRLSALLSHNPQAQSRLAELPSSFHSDALMFIEEGPAAHLALVEKSLTSGTASDVLIDSNRFPLLAALSKKLAPQVVDALLEHELKQFRVLHGVYSAIQIPGGQALVERLVKEGAPASHFGRLRLEAHLHLEELFGQNSLTMQRLLELEKHSGLKLNCAAELNNAEFIERLLTHENPAGEFNSLGELFGPFAKLAQSLWSSTDAIEKAAALTKSDGLRIERLNHFIREGLDRGALVAGEINRGATVARLHSSSWLPGLELVSKHLGSDAPLLNQAVRYAEQNRLSMWRLGSYLDGDPAARLPVVSKMIADGIPEGTRDLVRLTMFPQATAEKIADATSSGATMIAPIIAHARDLEYGANFVELLSRRAEQGTALTQPVIDELAQAAKNSPPLTSPFAAREPDEKRAGLVVTSETNLSKFAAHLNEAAKIILERFSPDRTIVVLGRDMNSFTPLLRAHGRKTIDFHLSRLQRYDASAFAFWKEEVPPNAIVIDSGVTGSMPRAIQNFDPSIEPYLLKSTGDYPQLLADNHLQGLFSDLESFPKLTGRCSGYRPSGAAICRLRERDLQDLRLPSLQASQWNRALMQELGLSDWYVWRYGNFTAVPRSERIGISSPERIQQYLKSVAELRARNGE